MIRLVGLTFLALALLLAGCATPEDQALAARRTAYEKQLKRIEPGMTRRELYALLPPCRRPLAHPPVLNGIVGFPIFTLLYEDHPLDADFSLRVEYRLAHLKEYPDPLKRFDDENKTLDDFLFKERVDHSCPSKQVMGDVLSLRPVLYQNGKPYTSAETHAFYHELTATHRFNAKGQIEPTP